MEALLDLVGEIYEASFNPSHWNPVLEKLCGHFGAKSGGIFVEDHLTGSRNILAVHGMPKLSQASYRFGLAKNDYAFQAQYDQPPGRPRLIIDQAQVKDSHPVYHKLLRLLDLGYIAGMNIYKDEEWFVGVGLHRAFKAKPFGDRELRELGLLYPHFRRAVRIHREFMRLRLREQTLNGALSKVMMGVIIIDAAGKVTYLNPVAGDILDRHPSLELVNGYLRAARRADYDHLKGLIEAASGQAKTAAGNLAMALHHPEREFPLTLMLAPLAPGDDRGAQAGPGSVALYVCDPESSINISPGALRSIYGMTEAEATVTTMIVNGLSPREISELNHVSVETVRSQLKGVFIKMGVSKQQDVIRVLLRGGLETL